MTESDRQNSWQTFSNPREITTKDGTIFFLLMSPDRKNVCRIDERFTPLIHEDFAALQAGNLEEIDIYCRPDRRDPCGWRLDVDYYRDVATGKIAPIPKTYCASAVEQPELLYSAAVTKLEQKNVTFCISGDDHAFVTALYKRMKQQDPAFNRFQDFNAYLYETQVRLLRMQHPDLWTSKQTLPF